MPVASPFSSAEAYHPREWCEHRGVRMAACFADARREYEAARAAAVVCDRSDRGLLVLSGRDRASWLHNLVTNAVKDLAPDHGVYAFACDVKGRIVSDLNVLARADALWLDVDRLALPPLRQHLESRLITEAVQIADASETYARLGVLGPHAADAVARVGLTTAAELPALVGAAFDDSAYAWRHDFAGVPGFELLVPAAAATDWWRRLTRGDSALPGIGTATLDILRIEAGIPWPGREIDETVLPPETGQIRRGISYQKGCYLGQEVIERMRSRGVLPRRLYHLTAAGPIEPLPAELLYGEQTVGRVTSLVRHPTGDGWIGLGYVRKDVPPEPLLAGTPPTTVQVGPAVDA